MQTVLDAGSVHSLASNPQNAISDTHGVFVVSVMNSALFDTGHAYETRDFLAGPCFPDKSGMAAALRLLDSNL